MERDLSVSPSCEDSAQYNVSTGQEPTQFLIIHARYAKYLISMLFNFLLANAIG